MASLNPILARRSCESIWNCDAVVELPGHALSTHKRNPVKSDNGPFQTSRAGRGKVGKAHSPVCEFPGNGALVDARIGHTSGSMTGAYLRPNPRNVRVPC